MSKSKICILICVILMSFTLFSCSSCSTGPENNSPNIPKNPYPNNYSTSISKNIQLTWECSDPDNDPITYEVYFGISDNPSLVNPEKVGSNYYHGTLDEETTYYWKIVAKDDHDNFATGEVWQFTTTTESTSPGNMVYVQGGTFNMGDHYYEGLSNEIPSHSVTLDNYYIGETEVTHQEVIDVFNWALSQGYINFSSSTVTNNQGDPKELLDIENSAIDWNGSSLEFKDNNYVKFSDCPCIGITWYGAVAYCNYKSLQEGLEVCYDLSDWSCNWSGNGYRLPTEAEWEYAARGGIYWNDDYRFSGCNNESDLTDYAWCSANSNDKTHPVRNRLPNQLGIYDMSGNVFEWCWDWFGSDYYENSPSVNPTGPGSGTDRVSRGGCWGWSAPFYYCRVSFRNYEGNPSFSSPNYGFRLVKNN